MSDWVVIETCGTRIEAEIVAALLLEEGIHAQILADDAGGLHPQLVAAQGARVLVPRDDAPMARWVLESQKNAGNP